MQDRQNLLYPFTLLVVVLGSAALNAAEAATLETSTTEVSCGIGAWSQHPECEWAVLTARGGAVQLHNPYFTQLNGSGGWYSKQLAPNCKGGLVLQDGESCVVWLTFAGTVNGQFTRDVQINSNAEGPPIVLHYSFPSLTLHGSLSSPCGDLTGVELGTSATCTMTVKAFVDSLTFAAEPIGDIVGPFAVQASTCTPGKTVNKNTSCTVTLTFTPTSIGGGDAWGYPNTGYINMNTTLGTVPLRLYGRGVGYRWQAGEWGSCQGDSSAYWQVGDWLPSLGCGEVEQTRTVVCVAASGTQTRSVNCVRDDGNSTTQVDEANCEGQPRPETNRTCELSSATCVGEEPKNSRITVLNNGCPAAGCKPDPENERYCLMMPL